MDRAKKLVGYGKMLAREKLVIGAGGNISEKNGKFLIIKKQGADMSKGRPGDYVRVKFSDPGAKKTLASSEMPLHLACYRARRDVGAVVHVHSPYMVAAAARTALLESPSYEFDCVLQKVVPVVGYMQPGSNALADEVGARIKEGANAVLMGRHGAVSVGKDISQACLRIMALERACIAFLHSQPAAG